MRAGLVRKKNTATLCFLMPFPSDTRSFVKTGSGQTYGKDLKSKRDDVIFWCRYGCQQCTSYGSTGQKTVFLSHLSIRTIILPRQARDTHRESTQKRDRFLTGDNNGTNTQLCTFPNASGCAQGKHTFQKPFYTKHDRFTKTGSGQTWGMHSQKAVVFLAG